MTKFMIEIASFLSEKARGLLLTVLGTGIGKVTNIVENIMPQELSVLEKVQILSYVLACIVALLTIISYGYKFYIWLKPKYTKKNTQK